MKLATVEVKGKEIAAVIFDDKMITVETINEMEGKKWDKDLFGILQKKPIS